MDEREIRKHVFSAYKQSLGKAYGDIRTYVRTHKPPPYNLTGKEDAALQRVMWELAVRGLISPRNKGVCDLLYDARLTDYGRECVKQGQMLPHDIDGYLDNLKTSMAQKGDKLILQYVAEALECFHHDNLRAAVVMLGVAAERSLEILRDAYLQTLNENEKSKALSKLNARMLRNRFDYLWKRIQQQSIPDEIGDRLEGDFWGAFHLIRRSRNEASHFTPVETNTLTTLACLASFPGYLSTLLSLVRYFEARSFR